MNCNINQNNKEHLLNIKTIKKYISQIGLTKISLILIAGIYLLTCSKNDNNSLDDLTQSSINNTSYDTLYNTSYNSSNSQNTLAANLENKLIDMISLLNGVNDVKVCITNNISNDAYSNYSNKSSSLTGVVVYVSGDLTQTTKEQIYNIINILTGIGKNNIFVILDE